MNRFSRGDQISLGGAVLLLVGLFLPWYGISSDLIPDGPGSDLAESFLESVSANAFEAFDFIDIVLLLLAVGAGVLLVLTTLGQLDASFKKYVETIGGAAAVIVLFRLFIQPEFASLKWGIFVALIGAVAIAAGQFLERTGKL